MSIKIPDELQKSSRTYFIIHAHDGVADIINGEYDKETNVFTFETDSFSPYAIGFEQHCEICHSRSPLIFGLCWLAVLIIVICLAGAGVGGFYLVKYLNNKKESDNNVKDDEDTSLNLKTE